MYIHDLSDTLHQFWNFQLAGCSFSSTMYVHYLYKSIPHQDGLRALLFFQEQRPEPSPPTTNLLCLVNLILTLNNFSFKSSHFLQVRGVAMGTCTDPSYACLFVGALNRVRPISRSLALTLSLPSHNSDRVPLILTYHPTSIHI
eukprot:g37699.t1